MKVEFTLTPEDYAAAMDGRVQNSLGKQWWAKYVSMAASFLFLLLSPGAILVGLGFPWPVVAGVSLFNAVLFFVLVFLHPLIFKRVMAGVMRRARLPAMSMSLEVRPDGLAVTTGTTASLTIWEGIHRIVVSDTHAFFCRNNVATHILPRRVFADERDFEEFVESARSYQEASKLSSEAKQL